MSIHSVPVNIISIISHNSYWDPLITTPETLQYKKRASKKDTLFQLINQTNGELYYG